MALNTLKCKHLTPLGLKGLITKKSRLLVAWCIAGVTDSNAVRVQAAVPGVDVDEHCTTYDG